MRVLFVSPEVPWPPINGLRLHVLHIAQELARRHEVCVLGFQWPEQREQEVAGIEVRAVAAPSLSLATRAGAFARGSMRGEPAAVALFTTGMRDQLEWLLAERRFDVAHVVGVVMAGLRPYLNTVPAIVTAEAWDLNLAAARALDPPLRRVLRRIEERSVRRFQARELARFERTVAITPQDAAAFRQLDGALEPVVITNGVDASRFAPQDGNGEPGHVVFTGALAYPPNVTAARFLAERVFPRVREAAPHARLSIVGRAPSPEVWRLARHDGVRVVPDVPDIRPWLWRARVYACPMVSGTGIKNKLLEAMACARPAVATPLACQGMDVHSEQQLLTAEDAPALATAILRLLADEPLGQRLGAAARRYVLENHSWSAVAAAYERVYQESVAARAARSTTTAILAGDA